MTDTPNIFADFADVEAASRLESNQNEKPKFDQSEYGPPRDLFNARKPAYTLKAERPEHRIVVMLKAAGHSNVEIANVTGYSTTQICYIVKQDWAKKQILEEIEKAGREPVLQMMRVDAMEAYQRIRNLAENAASEEVQRKCNESILDRVFGKASQPITITEKPAAELSDDELARLAQRKLN